MVEHCAKLARVYATIADIEPDNYIVPLEFRGTDMIDPPVRGIRFAGYPPASREGIIVVCEVTVDALQNLGGLTNPKPEELMSVFEIYKETIFQVASAKYDEGAYRPRITSNDLEYLTV